MMASIYRPILMLTARSLFIGLVNSFPTHSHLNLRKHSSIQIHQFRRLLASNANTSDQSNLETTRSSAAIIRRSQGSTALDSIEDAVSICLSHYEKEAPPSSQAAGNSHENILQYPQKDRESIGVASNLQKILNSFARSGVHCRRCWLQRKHCICERCVGLGSIPGVDRLFILTHHKEICLTVDTAKLIYASFPQTVDFVISGIPRDFQPLMGEMLDIVSAAKESTHQDIIDGHGTKCLILFPTDDATTFEDIVSSVADAVKKGVEPSDAISAVDADSRSLRQGWNVIVIDGTWSQARKMHAKYFPDESSGMLFRVQLSNEAVQKLNIANDSLDSEVKGLQLRRHPIKWREIGTLEATRLLLLDMHPSGEFDFQADAMSEYAEIGNLAAKRQIGPPRVANSIL